MGDIGTVQAHYEVLEDRVRAGEPTGTRQDEPERRGDEPTREPAGIEADG